MSREIQIQTGLKLKECYDCEIIINEIQEPHCIFNLIDVGRLLQITNIRSTARCDDKILVKCDTNGGKQLKSFINYNVLCKLLVKSRKPAVIDVCHTINFDINSKVYTCIEADTIKSIMEAFHGEQIKTQHRIGKYMVDLYFPDYNIIVECDEIHHKSFIQNDVDRENEIKKLCEGCVFIRYEPQSLGFNIFRVINRIYNTIRRI